MTYEPIMSLFSLSQMTPSKITVGETDILVIRRGEEVYALEATSTHAGAPLEKGALCEDKRVCPWHKSVFAITESRPGSLLEPPSLRALKRFPVKVEQDAVWIDPHPLDEDTPLQAADKQPTYVVLGAGAGGSAAINALREKGFTGRLVVVEREKQAPYDRLLLATGATPQRPDLPGKALRGVEVLRSWEQAATLVATVEREHWLVIIGNSVIGMEVAAALRKQAVEVTVVSPHPLPFEKQFGTELGRFFRRRHQEKGVTFVDGEPAAFEGEKSVSAVTLKDGQRIEATLVLLATGVAPATRFIHDLPLNEDGSLTVDRTMKVSADIFAIGDIATFPLDGNPICIEHWRVAQQHGRVAAGAMMDKPHPYDAVPFFWTQHYGVRYEYLGHAAKWDQQEIIGSPDEDNFVSLYGLKGNLVVVVAAGRMRTAGVLLIEMGDKLGFAEAQRIVADTREAES